MGEPPLRRGAGAGVAAGAAVAAVGSVGGVAGVAGGVAGVVEAVGRGRGGLVTMILPLLFCFLSFLSQRFPRLISDNDAKGYKPQRHNRQNDNLPFFHRLLLRYLFDKEANFVLTSYHIFAQMSISVKIYNQEGKGVSELELNKAIFGLPWNADLIHQAVIVALANKRQVLANTKDRSQVSGGGRKPWKQKGTGRARHGSIRSPLWVGGGVSFGPTNKRNFKLQLNQKMARRAILTVLSSKAKDGELIILDDLKISAAKTKEMAKIMANFPKVKNGLLVLTEKNEIIRKAASNLPIIEIADINSLNVLDILNHRQVIITKSGVEHLDKKYGAAK